LQASGAERGERESLPFLVELVPDGGESRMARLQLSVTEVSSTLSSIITVRSIIRSIAILFTI
jgi:hypothetical protein